MFYHAYIEVEGTKKGTITESYELDLSREELIGKIVLPYLQNKEFFCGGVRVVSRTVQRVRFNETEQSSAQLAPFIRAERRRSNIVSAIADEYFVTTKGTDLTRALLSEVEDFVSAAAPPQKVTASASPSRIFLVHGHDLHALDQAENILLRWGLKPVILRDQPNEGKTVIEKIEDNTDVKYAIVLMTPDECFGSTGPYRARQNVVFEWGYLMAKLGRHSVACLRKDDTEIPSDLHGIVLINFTGDVRNVEVALRRELVKAGFTVSA